VYLGHVQSYETLWLVFVFPIHRALNRCTRPVSKEDLPPAPHSQTVVSGVYFNGFALAVGSSDFTVALQTDNQPVIVLKASYTTMKTLAEKLTWAVQEFEKATQHPLMTIEDVKAKLEAADADKKNLK
jgi:hypothetical protein